MEEMMKAEINNDQKEHKEQKDDETDMGKDQEKRITHPYLGSKIDFSG